MEFVPAQMAKLQALLETILFYYGKLILTKLSLFHLKLLQLENASLVKIINILQFLLRLKSHAINLLMQEEF